MESNPAVTAAQQALAAMSPELTAAVLTSAAQGAKESALYAARIRAVAWLLAFVLCALSAVAALWLSLFFRLPWLFAAGWLLALFVLAVKAPDGDVAR